MEPEIWKPIMGFENRYLISNHGKVISLGRRIIAKDGFYRNYPERILKPKPNGCRGYVAVRLYYTDGTYKHIEVHRLVGFHFIDNPSHLPIINHKDTMRHNNHVNNLEWCSYGYNLLYKGAHRKGREKMKKKVFQYTLDGEFIKAWASATDAAKEGFDRSGICNVCNGHKARYKGFIWRYE